MKDRLPCFPAAQKIFGCLFLVSLTMVAHIGYTLGDWYWGMAAVIAWVIAGLSGRLGKSVWTREANAAVVKVFDDITKDSTSIGAPPVNFPGLMRGLVRAHAVISGTEIPFR